jgi:protoporphyrinogen oxidase
LNHEVCAVDLQSRKVRTTNGLEFGWDALLTSMPLPYFCLKTGEPSLVQAARHLTHSSTVSVNIGIRGTVAVPLQGSHWVYIPDRTIPIYRVGVYSNISPGVCSGGHSAIYAEVGLPSEQLGELDYPALQEKVIAAMEHIGWLDRRSIDCVVTHALHCAYVHHTAAAQMVLEQICEHLRKVEVYPIGRYGRWDYISMEDSIHDGLSTAAKVMT